ncbi:hypothetical protein PAHAL_8G259300 [Panicum hallii]|uniref:Uncharacterized protein n=1 Tax=Panicum hallii TaxID=206008 RepID=A0A2S3IFR3_9POAL|nr:hypothetical protein PAHAL_8G259300 [Panicum hallii]
MKQIMADEITIKRVAAINAADKFVSEDVKLSVSSSLKGGIDIEVGSSTLHMPQQSRYCMIQLPFFLQLFRIFRFALF